jgi:hypothetical protein
MAQAPPHYRGALGPAPREEGALSEAVGVHRPTERQGRAAARSPAEILDEWWPGWTLSKRGQCRDGLWCRKRTWAKE